MKKRILYDGKSARATSALPLGTDIDAAIAQAVYAYAETIMADSKANYCPVGVYPGKQRVGGNLRNTGTVHPPESTPTGTVVKLSYGGPGGSIAPYAAYVHEAPPGWGQGRNKYLERPLTRAAKDMEMKIFHAVRELMP